MEMGEEQGEKNWLANKETLIEKHFQNITYVCMSRVLVAYIMMSLVTGVSPILCWEHLKKRAASILLWNPEKVQSTVFGIESITD